MDDNTKRKAVEYAKAVVSAFDPIGKTPEETFLRFWGGRALQDPVILRDLLRDSREVRSLWDAVNLIAQQRLRGGRTLPPDLAEWVADVLADVKEQPRKPPRSRPCTGGRERFENFPRNIVVMLAVWHVAGRYNLNPTRNREIEGTTSACDVVADAMGLEYENTEKIWGKRNEYEYSPILRLSESTR